MNEMTHEFCKIIHRNIGHLSKRHRLDKNLTQKEIADIIGIHVNRYKEIEHGVSGDVPLVNAISKVILYANKLEMDPLIFFHYSFNGYKISPRKQLLKWQQELFEALGNIHSETRIKWSQALGKSKLNKSDQCFRIMTKLLSLDENKLSIIEKLVDHL